MTHGVTTKDLHHHLASCALELHDHSSERIDAQSKCSKVQLQSAADLDVEDALLERCLRREIQELRYQIEIA
jgi:CHAD domain-containing protein